MGDVNVTVTTTFGSVDVLIFNADSSGTVFISYFSSVTFCLEKKNRQCFVSEFNFKDIKMMYNNNYRKLRWQQIAHPLEKIL